MEAPKLNKTIDALITEVSEKVTSITGVQLGEKQRSMVTARLNRRMRDLGLSNLEDYASYFDKHENIELNALVSLLTTHHTFFFREFTQLELLLERLPEICKNAKKEGRSKLRLWISACSTGEEVYTFATFLKVHLSTIEPGLDFEIVASDIDPESVQAAKMGVYKWHAVQKIPKRYLSGCWMRGSGRISDFARIKDEIKNQCTFETVNLLSIPSHLQKQKFDLIICRNVFIYFETDQIQKIVKKYTDMLSPSGLILTGLSELLNEEENSLKHIGRSIYAPQEQINEEPAAVVQSAPARKVRVFCVDDSPTVHTILKKIVNTDGFEIVGKAKDGLEAAKVGATLEYDVMTLDIHMPNMNGLEYLKNHWTSKHPPVVILSSVSANDSDLALGCLNAGATDYVEKPTLQNFKNCADEIRSKLKSAIAIHADQKDQEDEIREEFAKPLKIENAKEKTRIVYSTLAQREKIKHMLRSSIIAQPANVLFMDCPENLRESIVTDLNQASNLQVSYCESLPTTLDENQVYVLPEHLSKELKMRLADREKSQLSLILFGATSEAAKKEFMDWKGFKIIEESDSLNDIDKLVDRVSVYTSLAYEADRFLAEGE